MDWFLYDVDLRHERVNTNSLKDTLFSWVAQIVLVMAKDLE